MLEENNGRACYVCGETRRDDGHFIDGAVMMFACNCDEDESVGRGRFARRWPYRAHAELSPLAAAMTKSPRDALLMLKRRTGYHQADWLEWAHEYMPTPQTHVLWARRMSILDLEYQEVYEYHSRLELEGREIAERRLLGDAWSRPEIERNYRVILCSLQQYLEDHRPIWRAIGWSFVEEEDA
jgi:hypothetical protein